jgi:hypothetical protein
VGPLHAVPDKQKNKQDDEYDDEKFHGVLPSDWSVDQDGDDQQYDTEDHDGNTPFFDSHDSWLRSSICQFPRRL